MSTGFFRKTALEKLSTPEQLDQLIKVTTPKGWILLSTLFIALTTALIWSVFGNIKTKLNVVGVILGEELHEVVSTSNGQLLDLKVEIGQKVKKGDIIAVLHQPEILQQIEGYQAIIKERELEFNQSSSFGSQDTRIQSEFVNQQRASVQMQISTEEKNIIFLNGQYQKEKELLNKGLITRPQINSTEQQIETAKSNIKRLRSQLTQSSSQELNLEYDSQQRNSFSRQKVSEAQRQLQQLQEQYDNKTFIKSPYDGEIVEVLTDIGIMVGAGTPLFKLKNVNIKQDKKLKGVLYISSQDGKKIVKDMEALISPSTVKPQDHGFIKAKVTYISEFPITQKGMLRTVKNEQLVQSLLSMGTLFEVYVEFEEDKNTTSGYKWTSSKGPDIQVNEGTSCFGKITIENERPISLVVPAFKKFFDLY